MARRPEHCAVSNVSPRAVPRAPVPRPGVDRWGLALLVLACCEYPFVRKVARSIGTILQPFPRVLAEGEPLSGGTFVDVAVVLAGAIFALLLGAAIPAIGSFTLRDTTGGIWLEAWSLSLFVQFHVLTFYLLPWSSLLLPDDQRLTLLSGFRIPGPRVFEIPVAVAFAWCVARFRTRDNG